MGSGVLTGVSGSGVEGGDCEEGVVVAVRSKGGIGPLDDLQRRERCFLSFHPVLHAPRRLLELRPFLSQPWEKGSCPSSH